MGPSGAFVTTTTAITSIDVLPVTCGTFAGDPADALETTASGGSALRYDPASNSFVYNWRTPGAAWCYVLLVTLADSGVHRADFNSK